MVTRAAKDLLRNTIRSTDYHNRDRFESRSCRRPERRRRLRERAETRAHTNTRRPVSVVTDPSKAALSLLEEDEMWRQWDLERGLTMMVTDDYLKKRMRMDQYPEPRKDPRQRLSTNYNKQDARRELNRRGNYWTQKLMDAEAKDPDRWGHSGFKELYPEEFRSRVRGQRARSRSYSSRSSSRSSHSSSSRRSSRTRGKHKIKKNKKEKRKKSNSRTDRRSDNETKELRHELRARHQQRRNYGRSTQSNSRDRGRDSPLSPRSQPTRSRVSNDALRSRNSRYGNSSLSPRRRSRSRSRESGGGRRRLNGPSTPSGSRASSISNSNRSDSGSSRARLPRARSRSYSPQPGSSTRHKVSALRARDRDNRSRSPAGRSAVSSSRSSQSSCSSSRSRSRSVSSNSSSSFSSDSESSRDERIAQQQQEQLARFRRHFRSRSLEKETMWQSPPIVEEMRLTSEEFDRRPVSLYPTIANPWRSAAYYDPNIVFSERQNIPVNGIRSPPHWDRLQLAYRNNRRNFRSRNRRSLAARERRRRRRQLRKRRRRRNANGMGNPGLANRANDGRARIGP